MIKLKRGLKSLIIFSGILVFTFLMVGMVRFFERTSYAFEAVNSKASFMRIIKDYEQSAQALVRFDLFVTKDQGLSPETGTNTSAEYSETNTQVKGIDEGDIIKTDGSFIYQLRYQELVISKAYPLDEAKRVTTIRYETFRPFELYVDHDRIIVIGSDYTDTSITQKNSTNDNEDYEPIIQRKPLIRVLVYKKGRYDKPTDTYEFDGYQVGSRKKDDTLLIIAQKYIPTHDKKMDVDVLLPEYAINTEVHTIGYDAIYYQDGVAPSYLSTVFKLNLSNNNLEHLSFLGASNNIYMSESALYLANTKYKFRMLPALIQGQIKNPYLDTTIVTKINYTDKLQYSASTEVNGRITNQFMMDEHNGDFRITTTAGQTWDETSTNNIYIYDKDLKPLGSIEGLAKGESIQSTRFVGDRIYMVTFRMIDPFFVIDASNPKKPKLLGELKIPGFSTYLHPYDDDHILGFGFEADEEGRTLGLKLALYEVTDPTNPIEKFKEVLLYSNNTGGSEVTYNHKALLFDKSRDIIGFPLSTTQTVVTTTEVNGQIVTNASQYYTQEYIMYGLNLTDGFSRKSIISHFAPSHNAWASQINRGLYIDNYLYTVSDAKIMVHDLKTYELLLTIKD